jgi:putative ABC transport system substrate-binding protein
MRRRDLITLVGGAAAAWHPTAHAQQPLAMRRIGVLSTFTPDDQEGQVRIAAFLQALQPFGWTVGRNLRIDYRWGEGGSASTRRNAAELVALGPDVILANGAAAVAPLLDATRTVPIVFVLVADPVGAGFVNSLARPGGNATGFTAVEYGFAGKWLELLKEIAPVVTRAAVIRDPAITAGIGMFGAIQSVAPHTWRLNKTCNRHFMTDVQRTLKVPVSVKEGGCDHITWNQSVRSTWKEGHALRGAIVGRRCNLTASTRARLKRNWNSRDG